MSMKSVTKSHLGNEIGSIFDILKSVFIFLLPVYTSKFLQLHKNFIFALLFIN